MQFYNVQPQQIYWNEHTLVADVNGQRQKYPFQFTGVIPSTKDQQDFGAVIMGNDQSDMIAILYLIPTYVDAEQLNQQINNTTTKK